MLWPFLVILLLQMKEYLSLTAEHFHLRTQHSPLVGFWTAELGGLNQAVHIWEYGGSRGVSMYASEIAEEQVDS